MTKKKVLAWILAAALILSVSAAAFAEELPSPSASPAPSASPSPETDRKDAGEDDAGERLVTRKIHISTAEALQAYALQCRMDSYSLGDTVILDNSIDLQGVPFHPFPSFSGTFEGNGYAISGFVNAEDGSNEGLFRYVEEEGSVNDLTVYGSVVSREGKTEVGGIVGTNYGLIDNCIFAGIVSGKDMVGGICGSNYGKIVNSRTEGTISGKTMVGGICGYNSGSLYSCWNKATVNPQVWKEETAEDIPALSVANIYQLNIAEFITKNNADTTMDIGGIAGYSDHIIYVCHNYGTIGYQRYGFNVGGIAGRQSNFVSKCQNFGSVYGRNGVGGIVGQNEPYMDLTDRQTMSGEILSMSTQFNATLDELSKDTDSGSKIVSDIASDTGDVLYSTQNALNDTGVLDSLEDDVEKEYGIETEANDIKNVEILRDDEDQEEEEEEPGLIDKALDKTKTASSNIDKEDIDDIRDKAGSGNKGDAWSIAADAVRDSGVADDVDTSSVKNAGDKAGETRQKAEDRVGKSTVDSVLDGNANEDDVSRIVYVGADEGIDGLGDGVDWISYRRTERKAEDEASQSLFIEDVTNGSKALSSMGDNYELLGNSLKETMNNLTTNFQQVNEHFTNIMNMMADALAGNFNVEIMKDISELNDDESMYGTITNSKNHGSVDGDECVGGIAGAMSIESDYDLNGIISDSLASNGLFTNTYETTCIVRACENDGVVTSRRDNTGGIVGKQDIGLIINSENYGNISGTGSYYGGVVGLSYASVNTCYSKCSISGSDYLGGIAGNGSVIDDCISLSEIARSDGSYVGAIAGYADMEAERQVEKDSGISADAFVLMNGSALDKDAEYTFIEQKCVTGNYFVNEDLGGVNGVSYTDLAQPVSYKTVMDYTGLPRNLHKWEIVFKADGRTVDTVEFEYGGSIDKLPEVPVKEGYTGFWEDFETEDLTASRTVNAIYIKNGNTVESDVCREDSGLSVVLVEGPIHGSAVANVTFRDEYKGSSVHGRKIVEAATVDLPGKIDDAEEFIIHYNPPAGKAVTDNVYILSSDGTWHMAQTYRQGSYLVFHSTTPVTFAVVSVHSTVYVIIVAALAAAAAAGVCFLYIRKKRKQGE